MPYTEANYENAVIEIFRDTLRYDYIYAPDLVRDYADPLYSDELILALHRVNPTLSDAAITEAVYKLRNFESGSTLHKNIQFMDYLQNGVSVSYYDNKEQRSSLVRLIDYEKVERNSFIVANQWTIVENSEKRPDVLVFINGLPVVIFELKSPSREETDASEAFLQLRNYMHEIPSLFIYNAFLVMSDLAITWIPSSAIWIHVFSSAGRKKLRSKTLPRAWEKRPSTFITTASPRATAHHTGKTIKSSARNSCPSMR